MVKALSVFSSPIGGTDFKLVYPATRWRVILNGFRPLSGERISNSVPASPHQHWAEIAFCGADAATAFGQHLPKEGNALQPLPQLVRGGLYLAARLDTILPQSLCLPQTGNNEPVQPVIIPGNIRPIDQFDGTMQLLDQRRRGHADGASLTILQPHEPLLCQVSYSMRDLVSGIFLYIA